MKLQPPLARGKKRKSSTTSLAIMVGMHILRALRTADIRIYHKTNEGKNMKNIAWHLLVREFLEGLFLSQQELAERCKVSQQSISNWKNRVRHEVHAIEIG